MPTDLPPASQDQTRELVKNQEQLRILSICHYVVAGMAALGGCFPIIHLSLGIAMVSGAMGSGRNAPPAFMGWFFVAFASLFMLGFWTMAVLLFIAGRNLARYTRRTFCFAIACLQVPIGTALGVFTIIVLSRPSVKAMFEETDRPVEPVG